MVTCENKHILEEGHDLPFESSLEAESPSTSLVNGRLELLEDPGIDGGSASATIKRNQRAQGKAELLDLGTTACLPSGYDVQLRWAIWALFASPFADGRFAVA